MVTIRNKDYKRISRKLRIRVFGRKPRARKKYWHLISQKEVNRVLHSKKTIGFVMSHYLQPDWCGYPDALGGSMWGCCSLNNNHNGGLRTKISKEFCKNCDCNMENQN